MGTIFPGGQGDIGIARSYAMSAIYVQEFDAFTNGHKDILEQAAHIFENVHWVMLVPMSKTMLYTWESRQECYTRWLEKQEWRDRVNFQVVFEQLYARTFEGLKPDYYIHGFRSVEDFLKEDTIEAVNKRLVPSIKTVYLKSDKVELDSQAFKLYKEYKEDLQQFVPYPIGELEEYFPE